MLAVLPSKAGKRKPISGAEITQSGVTFLNRFSGRQYPSAARVIFTGQMLGDDDNGFGKVIAGMYPVEYACSEKIAHYIKMRYDHEITDEETAYLAVHIRRIQPEKELEEDSH